MNQPRASVIVPALNEGNQILTFLERFEDSVDIPVEILVVVDSNSDNTLPALEKFHSQKFKVSGLVSTLNPGPSNAIKFGISASNANVLVITMADGSDDPRVVEEMVRLIERGCDLVSASRYMPGGQQIGGPRLKKFLSRNASRLLRVVLGIGTHDSTNSYKAYSKAFVESVGVESNHGFELGIELVAKAHRHGKIIAEVPTIWIDRLVGESNFKLRKWLPQYMRWFFYAFGPKLNR
jgi:dolichol-phosphate mannosyltransferase